MRPTPTEYLLRDMEQMAEHLGVSEGRCAAGRGG